MALEAYFISGLGADARVYERLHLADDIHIHHLEWIVPKKDELFYDYCKRLSSSIDTSKKFILVGLSLGGMAAIELNRIITPELTIIISSVTSEKEFSFLFRLIRFLRIHKFIPIWMLKTPNPLAYYFFGTKTKREKELLRSFMKNVSGPYLRWSMNVVMNWKSGRRPKNLIHIHGTKDKIFPNQLSIADVRIKGGGHLMVHDKAEEIGKVIEELIEYKLKV